MQLYNSPPHHAARPSYFGRRAFERHFKEWRHVNGMRALGIPNTKDFYEVTKIEDAMALWKTQQSRQVGPPLDRARAPTRGCGKGCVAQPGAVSAVFAGAGLPDLPGSSAQSGCEHA
jgi:hypothetical protein